MGIDEIHEAVEKICPIKSVRQKGELIELIFEDTASEQQKAVALSKLEDFKSRPPVARVLPLSDDEIRWVRDQMKAKG